MNSWLTYLHMYALTASRYRPIIWDQHTDYSRAVSGLTMKQPSAPPLSYRRILKVLTFVYKNYSTPRSFLKMNVAGSVMRMYHQNHPIESLRIMNGNE